MKKRPPTIPCIIPFTSLQISPQGMIYLCCPAWTKYGPVGKLTEFNTIDEIWNSPASQFIRQCVYRGTLEKVCNVKYCPYALAKQTQPLKTSDRQYRNVIDEIKHGKIRLHTAPRTLILANSGRCNLRCIMCWSNEDYVSEDAHINNLIYKRELPRLLPRLSEIVLSGNGDPFFMKDSRELLQQFDSKKYPDIKFNLITNALLLNPAMWQTVRHNHFGWIHVSIDAASKSTYSAIRRGGNWEMLTNNLKLIGKLRQQGLFSSFRISFVVMKSNYREMKQFAQMGLRLGADRIIFQKIFGMAAIAENINLTRNKAVLSEIAGILADPVFRHPAVDTNLIQEYTKFKNIPVRRCDKIVTGLLEQSAYFIHKSKLTENKQLRAALIWSKAHVPYSRKLLGW